MFLSRKGKELGTPWERKYPVRKGRETTIKKR
jgi:hypothetical protein